ncbi:hypothetical protein C8R46DRAFT_1027655 [Mycena filopes]|nr:hypothetical protein C8R46DRAFT_1027655 [Mycena filopes]
MPSSTRPLSILPVPPSNCSCTSSFHGKINAAIKIKFNQPILRDCEHFTSSGRTASLGHKLHQPGGYGAKKKKNDNTQRPRLESNEQPASNFLRQTPNTRADLPRLGLVLDSARLRLFHRTNVIPRLESNGSAKVGLRPMLVRFKSSTPIWFKLTPRIRSTASRKSNRFRLASKIAICIFHSNRFNAGNQNEQMLGEQVELHSSSPIAFSNFTDIARTSELFPKKTPSSNQMPQQTASNIFCPVYGGRAAASDQANRSSVTAFNFQGNPLRSRKKCTDVEVWPWDLYHAYRPDQYTLDPAVVYHDGMGVPRPQRCLVSNALAVGIRMQGVGAGGVAVEASFVWKVVLDLPSLASVIIAAKYGPPSTAIELKEPE